MCDDKQVNGPMISGELRANYIDYCGGMDPETDRPGSLRYVRNIDAWYGRCPACGERVRLEHLMADDHFSRWFERLARRKDVSDHAAQRLLYAHVLPVLQDLLGVGDLDDLDDLDALDALFAEGRHRDDETNHGSRCTRARYWALDDDDPIAPELRALLKRSRRYGICLVNPNLIELFDKRYKLENFLKWQYLWPDERLRLALGDDMYLDQLDLFAGLSAGPTLSDTDDELLMCLETNVYSIGNDDLAADPSDPTVADWRALIYERSLVFKGSPADAEIFLHGVLEGRIELPPSPPSPPVPPAR